MKSKYDEYTQEQRIEDLKNIVKIQTSKGNYDVDEYMRGMANGLLLAQNIICEPYGTDDAYIDSPNKPSQDNKPKAPREFLIDSVKPQDDISFYGHHAAWDTDEHPDMEKIHPNFMKVIEFSAYENLKAQLDIAMNFLKQTLCHSLTATGVQCRKNQMYKCTRCIALDDIAKLKEQK